MQLGKNHSPLLGGNVFSELFNPKSVAIIGASSNPNKWGNWLAEQVAKHSNKRSVYFVNPKKEIIFDIECVESISQILEPIEVAIVVVPPASFETTVDDLLTLGTGTIVGITSEVDMSVQKRVAAKCILAKTRLIGPNCAGLWSSDFCCWPSEFRLGPVAMISQSGGVLIDVYERLSQVEIGVSKVLSIGNTSDVSFIDVLPILEKDPNTKVIILYVEETNSIPFTLIGSMTKPVLILSAKTTPMSRKAALLHTNSKLTHDTELTTYSISKLIALVQSRLYGRKASGNNAAVVTDSGGMGVFINSLAERSGLNIVSYTDLIGLPSAFSEKTFDKIAELIKAADVDVVIVNLLLYNEDYDEAFHGKLIAELVLSTDKPVIFSCRSLSNPGVKSLLEKNIPVYRDIETSIEVVKNICGL